MCPLALCCLYICFQNTRLLLTNQSNNDSKSSDQPLLASSIESGLTIDPLERSSFRSNAFPSFTLIALFVGCFVMCCCLSCVWNYSSGSYFPWVSPEAVANWRLTSHFVVKVISWLDTYAVLLGSLLIEFFPWAESHSLILIPSRIPYFLGVSRYHRLLQFSGWNRFDWIDFPCCGPCAPFHA